MAITLTSDFVGEYKLNKSCFDDLVIDSGNWPRPVKCCVPDALVHLLCALEIP